MQAFPQPRGPVSEHGLSGFAALAQSMAAELCGSVPEAQALGFFRALGQRMAAMESLEGVNDTAVLSARLNAFWQALEWGEIDLVFAEDGIIVEHRHLPTSPLPDDKGHWQVMLSGVLEGAYDSWFKALGSGPTLQTTTRWKGDVLELRHGR